MLHTLRIKTEARNETRDVTAEVGKLVRTAGVKSGVCYLYVPHTTAAVAVNESDDPDVMADVDTVLRVLHTLRQDRSEERDARRHR